jgi:hypothetical protein
MKRWRHFVVVIGIIPLLIMYVAFFMYAFEFITGFFWLIDWIIYILAGFIMVISSS